MSDPRFDPRFQRGYVPRPGEEMRVVTPVAPVAGAPPRVEPMAIVPNGIQPDGVEPDETPTGWMPRRPNPYSIALPVVGILLLVLGIWMIVQTANGISSSGQFDPSFQVYSLVVFSLPPALIFGGVLALVAWLVLGYLGVATRRRARR